MGLLETMKEGVAELLFPRFCVSCREPGAWWCESCQSSVQRLSGRICPRCLGIRTCNPTAELGTGLEPIRLRSASLGAGCETCNGALPFASVSSFGYYHDPKLRSVITALKFNGTSAVLHDLQAFIASRPIDLPMADAVIPMPLSQERLRERGFNQAELIAEALLSCNVKRETWNVLVRIANRIAQSSLEHDVAARRANVAGAFACHGAVPSNVLLVDDVVTTGATAGEAARALLAAGAQQVHLLTLAIGA